MKRSLISYAILLCILTLTACSTQSKKTQLEEEVTMSRQDAQDILKYYDLSLSSLKNWVNTDQIKEVMTYLDAKGDTTNLPFIEAPQISAADTTYLVNPGNYFDNVNRKNLKENYKRLFPTITAFYENYNTYRLYMQNKDYKNDNYALADKIRKEELILSISLTEYKSVVYDILTPLVKQANNTISALDKLDAEKAK